MSEKTESKQALIPCKLLLGSYEKWYHEKNGSFEFLLTADDVFMAERRLPDSEGKIPVKVFEADGKESAVVIGGGVPQQFVMFFHKEAE